MQIPIKPYTVIVEGISTDESVRIPDAILKEIKELYEGSDEGMEMLKERLIHLISEYPNVPILHYLLGQWYDINELFDESNVIYKDLSAQYPDFVLGVSSYISSLLEEYEVHLVDKYFDNNFDIGHHFPNRKVFDQMEYNNFMSNVIHFLAINGRFAEAEEQLATMRDTTGNEAYVATLSNMMEGLKNADSDEEGYEDADIDDLNSWEQDETWNIYDIETPTLPQRPVMVLPTSSDYQFIYGEDEWDIDADELRKSIERNKEELVAELKVILTTAVTGYEYCSNEEEWSSAVLHAFLLLPYLDEENSLPHILILLGQPEECIDYWLAYEVAPQEFLLPYFKSFSDEKLQSIKDFLLLSPGNSNSKVLLTELLVEFVNHNPVCKEKVINVVKEVLEHYIKNKEDKYLVNFEVVDSLVYVAINTHASDLIPLVRQVYALDITSKFQGTIEQCIDFINDISIAAIKTEGFADLFKHLQFLKVDAANDHEYKE